MTTTPYPTYSKLQAKYRKSLYRKKRKMFHPVEEILLIACAIWFPLMWVLIFFGAMRVG